MSALPLCDGCPRTTQLCISSPCSPTTSQSGRATSPDTEAGDVNGAGGTESGALDAAGEVSRSRDSMARACLIPAGRTVSPFAVRPASSPLPLPQQLRRRVPQFPPAEPMAAAPVPPPEVAERRSDPQSSHVQNVEQRIQPLFSPTHIPRAGKWSQSKTWPTPTAYFGTDFGNSRRQCARWNGTQRQRPARRRPPRPRQSRRFVTRQQFSRHLV
jgi:hypothetical protein